MRTAIKLALVWLLALVGVAWAATSYTNPLGSGDRKIYLATASSAGSGLGDGQTLVNGAYDNAVYFSGGGASGITLSFDFGAGNQFVIDEATWYQSTTQSHGSWKWQRSDDGSSWTDIGSAFTLGESTAQVQTELSVNSTAYRYYRLLGVSGNVSNGPYIQEVTLKIGEVVTSGASYLRKYGTGVRTAVTTCTTDVPVTGDINNLVNGTKIGDLHFNDSAVAGKYVKFAFAESVILTEAKWIQHEAQSHGSWKWQGSTNDSSWTDIGNAFTLGGATTQLQTELNGNTTAYNYYRLLGISGNATNLPWLYEVDFKPAAPITSQIKSVSLVPLAGIGKIAGELMTTHVGKVAGVANQ